MRYEATIPTNKPVDLYSVAGVEDPTDSIESISVNGGDPISADDHEIYLHVKVGEHVCTLSVNLETARCMVQSEHLKEVTVAIETVNLNRRPQGAMA